MKEYTVTDIAIFTGILLSSVIIMVILFWQGNLTTCSMLVAMLGILTCADLISKIQSLHKKFKSGLPAFYVAVALALVSCVSSFESVTNNIGQNAAELLAAIAVVGTLLNLSALICKVYS